MITREEWNNLDSEERWTVFKCTHYIAQESIDNSKVVTPGLRKALDYLNQFAKANVFINYKRKVVKV